MPNPTQSTSHRSRKTAKSATTGSTGESPPRANGTPRRPDSTKRKKRVAVDRVPARNSAAAERLDLSRMNPGSSRLPAGRDDMQLRFRLATLLRISDNIVTAAISVYDRLFALDREDEAEIYLEMSRQYAQDDKVGHAALALRQAAHLRPNDKRALLELGEMHVRRKAPEAAIEVLSRARDLGEDGYRLHWLLADALMQQDRPEEALDELREAARLQPEMPDPSYRVGLLLDELGRYEEAVAAFRTAVELDPDCVIYHQRLGFALESAGKRREAIKCFKRAMELEDGVGAAE